jgi:exocyst complex component 2
MTAEWKSQSKVIARTGQGDGKGEVILKTKTGGVGTCTVYFNAIPFNPGTLHTLHFIFTICLIVI